MKKVLGVVCLLVGTLLGCVSIFCLWGLGFAVAPTYDGTVPSWILVVLPLASISSVLSFIAGGHLLRSDKKEAERRWQK